MTDNRAFDADPLRRLFRQWLALVKADAAAYLVANGERGPHEPAHLAAACLSMLGRPEVAAWALEDHRRVAA